MDKTYFERLAQAGRQARARNAARESDAGKPVEVGTPRKDVSFEEILRRVNSPIKK